MTAIEQVFVPELNRYVTAFDSPDSIPDDYEDTHVAVPQESMRPEEQRLGGVGYIRPVSQVAGAAGVLAPGGKYFMTTHATYDEPGIYAPGVLPTPLIALAIAICVMVVTLAIVTYLVLQLLMQTSGEQTCIKEDSNGECQMYRVRAGTAWYSYNPQTNEWKGLSGNDDLIGTVIKLVVIGAAAYIGFKVILPMFTKKGGNNQYAGPPIYYNQGGR